MISQNAFNVGDPNEPIERQIVSMGWKIESAIRNPLQVRWRILKVSAWRTIYWLIYQNKTRVAVLISGWTDIRTRRVISDNTAIMIKGQVC